MQMRRLAVIWCVTGSVAGIAIAAALLRADEGPASAPIVRQEPTRVSRALAARTEPTPAATPTLREAMLAADALYRAGKLEPEPSLRESLLAADLLIRAGVIEPPPGPVEQMHAAAAYVWVNRIILPPPPPTLRETLLAAEELVRAGVIEPPPPSLGEVLRAVYLIEEAKKQAAAPPPAAAPPAAPPPASAPAAPAAAPAPTSTPVPPPPPAPPSPAPPAAASASGWTDAAFAAEVFAEVNRRRAQSGLAPVTVEPRLQRAAETYAQVLTENYWFSHTGPDGSTLVTRVEAAGFPFTVQVGEVLAWGSNGWSPAEIVQAWIDSPAHREQILSPVYRRAGAGCYFSREDGTLMVRCVMDLAG